MSVIPIYSEPSNFKRSSPLLQSALPTCRVASFEGPLDLLLHLIRSQQIDINDIPIFEITSQYVLMIETLDLSSAGEYLVMAATLIEIKSRLLLPSPPPNLDSDESDDPRAELVARLLEYEQYRGVLDTFQSWEEARRHLFFRGSLQQTEDYILPVEYGEANVISLFNALQQLLDRKSVV